MTWRRPRDDSAHDERDDPAARRWHRAGAPPQPPRAPAVSPSSTQRAPVAVSKRPRATAAARAGGMPRSKRARGGGSGATGGGGGPLLLGAHWYLSRTPLSLVRHAADRAAHDGTRPRALAARGGHVRIGGALYAVAAGGRSLTRASEGASAAAAAAAADGDGAAAKAVAPFFVPRRVELRGVTYVRTGTGGNTLVRSLGRSAVEAAAAQVAAAVARAHAGRARAARTAAQLSLPSAARPPRAPAPAPAPAAARTAGVAPCLFFNRFGHCSRGARCTLVHDPTRIAACRRFLRGECTGAAEGCKLSHAPRDATRVPVCRHFLRGVCANDACPYSHVAVAPDAPPCTDFLAGHCALGERCLRRHVLAPAPRARAAPPADRSLAPAGVAPTGAPPNPAVRGDDGEEAPVGVLAALLGPRR